MNCVNESHTFMSKSKMMKNKKILTALVCLIVAGSAFTQSNERYFEIAKNLEVFTSVYKQLNTHYVDELDPNTLMRTGIDAMMNSLDPYTVYYSESQVASYRLSTDNKYNGLGAGSSEIDDQIVITEIYENGPSHDAGIHIGDVIKSVNGMTTRDRSHKDVLQILRGFPGTAIKLSVHRPGTNEDLSFSVTRSEVDIPNVPYHGMISDHVGYIVLTTFTRDAGKNIAAALRDLKDNNELKGIVLDLRNNGGGLLAEAIDILGIFLPKSSPAVSTKGKVRDRDVTYNTRRTPIDTKLPIVVLTNKSSASASEIVSGSLQDYDRGVVMGQRTYGKGLVQNHQEVGYNSRIKVTTSKYYIPSGRCIQSVEYANGEPVDISDEKRETFYTKAKRPVLDGGGVTPDVPLTAQEKPEVLSALASANWIFKYVNNYIDTHPDTPVVESFAFTDYNGFIGFLKKEGFSYDNKAEKSLNQLLEDTEGNYAQDVATLKAKIAADKADDLEEYKERIVRDLEIEIIKRYHFQKGKSQQNLKSDQEIVAAIELLNDLPRYNKILGH
ncbi:MAG: carboxyl-terminal processing protease [Saprospiraceae bacterium]|jgi:carboxyl-terminal processing protease